MTDTPKLTRAQAEAMRRIKAGATLDVFPGGSGSVIDGSGEIVSSATFDKLRYFFGAGEGLLVVGAREYGVWRVPVTVNDTGLAALAAYDAREAAKAGMGAGDG